MGMTHDELELLTDLKRLCNEAGQFALDFMAGTLSIQDEESYGLRLAEVAGQILVHARGRGQLVIEGQATVIDGLSGGVILEPGRRELPPGSWPGDGGS